MSALALLQTSVYALVSADATFTALVGGRFYNDVPDGAAFPHVQMGSATERGWHTMGGATVGIGWQGTLTLHVWSRYQGDSEALAIVGRLVTLLNFQSVTVTGYPTVIVEYDNARVLVESPPPDKLETRHVPAVFKFRVHTK